VAEFTPKTFPQILGDMIATVVANSPLTDASVGSVVRTMLEAAAQEDDEQYFQMLNILRSFSLDTTTGLDLDARGEEFGITRQQSQQATTVVTLGDSSFSKVQTGVFSGAVGPLSGETAVKADSSTGFPVSGSIIIGRGTPNSETVGYSSITAGLGFVTFNLSAGLSFDHGTDESIILSQGGNRVFTAGLVVAVPASDLSEKIDFSLDSTVTLLDGEVSLTGVAVTAVVGGSGVNVSIGAISTFDSPPFSTATVTNPNRVTNGRDLEGDQEYRDRIKDRIQSLSRGTGLSIISGVAGLVSSEENKRVVSASIVEPTTVPDIVKLYIDDGTGFIPSSSGVGFEEVVAVATGGEQFLGIDNVPVMKASLLSTLSEPFDFSSGGETLTVDVGNDTETVTFATSDFVDPANATAVEVQVKFNKASLFEARVASNGTVRIFARRNKEDDIIVTGGTANAILGFPQSSRRYTTHLYKSNRNAISLLSKDGATARIESGNAETFDLSGTTFNLCVVIDGKTDTPIQIPLFTSDFVDPANATAEEVVAAIGARAPGLSSEASLVGTRVKLFSRLLLSVDSKIQVVENFDQVFNEESSVDTDRTTELSALAGTANLFAVNSDYVHVGHDTVKFNSVYVQMSTPSSDDIGLLVEYWNGSTWVPVGVFDGTAGFTQNGIITIPPLFDWMKTAGPGTSAYWLRLQRTTVTVTTPPVAQLVRVCSANAVLAFPSGVQSGADADYTVNRFVGQIELLTSLVAGEKLVLGSDDTRAFVTTVNSDTYNFTGGGQGLNVTIDGVAQSYTFLVGDFVDPANGTAAEVAAALNAGLTGVSAEVVDTNYVKLTIKSHDSTGTIIVTGGTANVILGFPTTQVISLQSHYAFAESGSAENYSFTVGDLVIVVIDGEDVDLFSVPCTHASVLTGATDTTHVIDSNLSSYFPNATDLVGFELEMTSGAQSGERKTITAYDPGTGTVTLNAALTGTPLAADTYEILPVTAEDVVFFWNNKKITSLSNAATIEVSDGGRRVQIVTLTIAASGSVQVTGGAGNATLNFSTSKFVGVDGYQFLTGLAQIAQWVVDGRPDDQETYPGLRAVGNQVEVLEPALRKITIEIDVTTQPSVSLTSVINDVKSAVSAYINGLGVGEDVILSDIVVAVKGVAGVFDAVMLTPVVNTPVSDNELARISEADIAVV